MPDRPFNDPRDDSPIMAKPNLTMGGRTAGSPDNAQGTHFFLINDSGTYFLRTLPPVADGGSPFEDRKSTRLNSSHANLSYAVFCLNKNNLDNILHQREFGVLYLIVCLLKNTATTDIYTLSLHGALPSYHGQAEPHDGRADGGQPRQRPGDALLPDQRQRDLIPPHAASGRRRRFAVRRSEEHTSEL